MKKILIFGICILLITNIFGRGIIVDSLSIYNKVKKENINKIELKKVITKDSIFVISDEIKSTINGICVTGTGTLYSDTSLIRIIAIDIDGNEYLMYESTILSEEIGKIEFYKRSDEAFLLEPFSLSKVIIQLINAEVKVEELTYYNSTEWDKQKRSQLRESLKKEISDKKLYAVKSYIKKNKMIWTAYNNSHATSAYSSKKKEYGEKYNTYGLEYYKDGFFKLPPSFSIDKVKLKSATTTSFVSDFDWRNRHGQNWLTPNKCQSGCWLNNTINCNFSNEIDCTNAGGIFRSPGTCWAFGTIAAVEALTNLYFNQHINYDLSAQQLVSCCSTYDNLTGFQTNALDYIQDHGAVPESCYPYFALKGDCNSVCSNPQERVSFLHYSSISYEDDLKKSLIAKGPMVCDMGAGWTHSLLYIGFGTVKVGDYIDFTGGNTIQPGDLNIGKTYWILKDNNTYTGWPYHAGFIYMLDQPDYANPIDMPITSQIYSTNNIICSDNDHDGYYWWGIGPKPATCPLCSSSQEDGDDSNPNLGPMDEYGNCTLISSPYAFPNHEIISTETWQNPQTECGNVIVKNGGNLTINGATINLGDNANFSVEVGGIFTFNSGTIQ